MKNTNAAALQFKLAVWAPDHDSTLVAWTGFSAGTGSHPGSIDYWEFENPFPAASWNSSFSKCLELQVIDCVESVLHSF